MKWLIIIWRLGGIICVLARMKAHILIMRRDTITPIALPLPSPSGLTFSVVGLKTFLTMGSQEIEYARNAGLSYDDYKTLKARMLS